MSPRFPFPHENSLGAQVPFHLGALANSTGAHGDGDVNLGFIAIRDPDLNPRCLDPNTLQKVATRVKGRAFSSQGSSFQTLPDV